MNKRNIFVPKIIFMVSILLILAVFIFTAIRMFPQIVKANTTITNNLSTADLFKEQAIQLTKKFALSFFDGTAFTQNQNQPVIESYKKYLQFTEADYLSKGDSPLGGSVLKFGKEFFLPETDQNPLTYAVWIITTIRTRFGVEKEVVFITRVKPEGNTLLIMTAGAIPYQH